jgi:OmpA-OmpF porin, OOP family
MMKKFAAALLLSVVSAAPAFAADAGTAYVNLDYSKVNLGSPSLFGLNGTTAFPNPGALRIGGGYNFTPNVAVEAGYSIIGDSTINASGTALGLPVSSSETMKTRSFQLAAVGTYSINEQFDVFGKLGLANNKGEYSCSLTVGGTAIPCTSVSGSKTSVMYGIGAKYNINKTWGVRLQYEHLGKVDLTSGPTTVSFKFSTISVGGVYTF